jgi:hypothetical protein
MERLYPSRLNMGVVTSPFENATLKNGYSAMVDRELIYRSVFERKWGVTSDGNDQSVGRVWSRCLRTRACAD